MLPFHVKKKTVYLSDGANVLALESSFTFFWLLVMLKGTLRNLASRTPSTIRPKVEKRVFCHPSTVKSDNQRVNSAQPATQLNVTSNSQPSQPLCKDIGFSPKTPDPQVLGQLVHHY
ncbi:hypothetical protein XELAEV_18043713mg [Xenopus laevis]|uniref:Uncharacterized protein n=1 Tax=Xenopus laevis TaxID=8355 RepID=A0A974H2N4_XENLA|nr:hypothetical protein XELAEV_18043713mg [Xenopus laevis]